MQKIFIVNSDTWGDSDEDGNFEIVNEFIEESGVIISVTPQSMGGDSTSRGRWLVVADDGKSEKDLLP